LVIGGGNTAELKKGNHYFQVKESRFEKNVIIAKSSENKDDDRIVIWGYGDQDHELKPKDSYFRDNHILAKSGTMLNRYNNNDKLELDLDKYFTDNILYNQGSAEYGDILTRDNSSGQCRPPPAGEPEARKVDILEDKDVGPNSKRADQRHFSRDELQEIIGEFRGILEDKEEHKLEYELGKQFKSILSEPCQHISEK
jgi:hypothetical protein